MIISEVGVHTTARWVSKGWAVQEGQGCLAQEYVMNDNSLRL